MKSNVKFLILTHFIFFSTKCLFSQSEVLKPSLYSKKFASNDILDSVYGITAYNKLVKMIGGDSVRYFQPNKPAQDWVEDYYTSGKLLHKGYYIDGKLRVFKNFYENGVEERSYKITGSKSSEMSVFYPDGKAKSYVEYIGEVVVKQQDYFSNGKLEYEEESAKDGEIVWKKISYFQDGSVDNSLEVTDRKNKIFKQKEYYPGGKIKIDGDMKYNKALTDYVKEGVWNYYDESGKLTKTEKYYKGHLEE
jgi:antitoxin component YwqK of YwqJK toxin-antitoxin module